MAVVSDGAQPGCQIPVSQHLPSGTEPVGMPVVMPGQLSLPLFLPRSLFLQGETCFPGHSPLPTSE